MNRNGDSAMKAQYETQRLELKILTPDYCHEVLDFYQYNRRSFRPYEPRYPRSYYTADYQYKSLSFDYQAYLEQKGVRFYLFQKNDPDTIIGTISFSGITHGYTSSAVVGYKLDSRFRHQGYAFEALQKGIEILFYEEKIHRINAYIMQNNTASLRLIQRLYFTYEGIAREYAFIQGKWEDHLQFSLISHL